jgi:hypothetical protein
MNLANLTANRYKIVLEETWYHERSEVRSADKIWYEQISCRGGALIGLYSLSPLTLLQLWTPRPKNARIVWESIKDTPEVRADFAFDGEAVIYFPLESLQQVAELAGAKRKRRLSEEEKAKLVEMGKGYRFKSKINGSNGAENGADLDDLA